MHSTRYDPSARADPRSRSDAGDLGALARLSGLATVLGLAVLALLSIGRRLPAPPLSPSAARSTDAWAAWLTRLGPAGALMSMVRVVSIVLAAYLLILVVVEVIGRAAGLHRILSLGDRLSTPLTRQLVGGVAGLGLAFSVTALTLGPTAAASADTISMQRPATAATDPAPPPTTGAALSAVPVMHAIPGPEAAASASDAPTTRTLEPAAPVMHAVEPAPVPTTGAPSATTSSPPVTTPPPTAVVAPTSAADAQVDEGVTPGPVPDAVADRWVIQSGDHLWGVARRTLAGTWHRPPTDAETARYLDRLVEANLEVLVVPGDADLVRPGQVFVLPLVPTG